MKVIIFENHALNALAQLKSESKLSFTDDLSEAQIAMVRSQTHVDLDFLERAKNLKMVVTATSGFDHIDWRECVRRKIMVTHTPEANAASTAELTLTLILGWERQLLESSRHVRENKWREGLRRPRGLQRQALGIVGLGRVGQRVAKLARAFGMEVSAYDPYVDEQEFLIGEVQRLSFIELLRTCDYVSLHVPLTKETRHLMNNPTLAEMQTDAILINTCRGPVVDENALLTALDEGTIAGAAMDVIEREPPPKGHRSRIHPKLLLTPHIGAFTESAWEQASLEAADKILRFVYGQPIPDTLPLVVPWFDKT